MVKTEKTIGVSGFPCLVAAENVKNFLEQYTGRDTIFAVDVKPSKRGGRAYARVQFTNTRCAEFIIELTKRRLYYGNSYLRAWESDNDIVPPQRAYAHEMKDVTLNFGCQISNHKFLVLWKEASVSVKFGLGMKKMHFFFVRDSVDYRLQLSYENIWQIVSYPSTNHLVIQLFGAPRIYKKQNGTVYSYFMEIPDDQWIRTTDYTPSFRIGQSSGLCLKLHHGSRVPNFEGDFVYYRQNGSTLDLEMGEPFSHDVALVPIIRPSRGVELSFEILFKVCSLVQTGCLPGPKLDAKFFQLVNPYRYDQNYIKHALEKLYYLRECCYDPVAWLREQYEKYRTLKELPKSPDINLDDGLVYVRRVEVTPCRVYFQGPEVNVSNRVLRQYKDHTNFIRVSFVDEEWNKMYSTDLSPRVGGENGRTKLYERVLSTLKDGIRIGNRKFDFLAFSSSQLRENSVWMFASTDEATADDIRRWMGDFRSIRNVAKYAARLGQSFGSSTETLKVERTEVERIPDIRIAGTNYVFSDGIGKISADFARRVAAKCGVKGIPSAFQIRYGGYKGVVAVDPDSQHKLSLRPSMLKYESDNIKLDVLAWTKYQPCFLNRQIITLLSTLGVADRVFEKKQSEAVAQLDEILVDPLKAEEALDLMSPGENTNILKEMLKCGYKPDEEPFLSMMLQTFRASKLMDLRLKARIFIPKARQLMGCLDERGILKYGQVFVQVSVPGQREPRVIDELVVVAKNPCLHPGDVRILEAIDVPALYHMVDCVVFPRNGKRPHPNECSGSDLDGDLYFVSWDSKLIPPRQVPPMNYDPAPPRELDHDVTIEEVQEYFANYIINDSLGIIANAHTAFADKEPLMALSQPCIQLAHLFSIAVDFPKTGIPAEIPSDLRVKEYPDFMEKPDKTTYESLRVIGKLFRAVKNISPTHLRSFTKEVARKSYDRDMEVDGFREYIDEAFEYKTEYDNKLGNLMEYYGIKTEGEILSGSAMKMSKTFDRRKDSEAISAAVRSLRNEARSWFKRGGETDDPYAKASAWYHVAYHPVFWGAYNVGLKRDHYISFPWCVYDKLIQIKKDNARNVARISRLEEQLRSRLRLR